LLQIQPEVLSYHMSVLKKNTNVVEHGLSDSKFHCHFLNPLEQTKTKYTRLHPGVQNRRGPYQKAGYSFSGGYGQVTHSLLIHNTLGLQQSTFDHTYRTIQATHVVLLYNNYRPPENCRLYQASHLCGNSSCIRHEHLLWERLDKNFARRMCHVYGAFEECPHTPQCILRAPYTP
jgi:hypothetical protein